MELCRGKGGGGVGGLPPGCLGLPPDCLNIINLYVCQKGSALERKNLLLLEQILLKNGPHMTELCTCIS